MFTGIISTIGLTKKIVPVLEGSIALFSPLACLVLYAPLHIRGTSSLSAVLPCVNVNSSEEEARRKAASLPPVISCVAPAVAAATGTWAGAACRDS